MGNCSTLCNKHGRCFKKRTHPAHKRPVSKADMQTRVMVPVIRVGWTDLVDGNQTVEHKDQQQGNSITETNADLKTHRRKQKRKKRKENLVTSDEIQTSETIKPKDSYASNSTDEKLRRNLKPKIDIFGKRHSISPHYNKEYGDRQYLLLKPIDQEMIDQKEHSNTRRKKKKHERQDLTNDPQKAMTDETRAGQPKQTGK